METTESNNISHHSPIVNFLIMMITPVLGFISLKFEENIKNADLLLSPIVKLTTILSFSIYVLLNYDRIKDKIKNFKLWK